MGLNHGKTPISLGYHAPRDLKRSLVARATQNLPVQAQRLEATDDNSPPNISIVIMCVNSQPTRYLCKNKSTHLDHRRRIPKSIPN